MPDVRSSLFLYALLGALLAGIAYFVYTSYLAPTPTLSTKKSSRSASSGTGTATRPSAVTAKSSSIVDNRTGEKQKVDESWVPEHHLRRTKSKSTKAAGGGGVTSGEESEGGASGRRSRK